MFSLPSLFLSWSLSLWAGWISCRLKFTIYQEWYWTPVLQHPPPKCCNCRHVLLHGVYVVLRMKCVHFTHGAISPDSVCLLVCFLSFRLSCVCNIFFFILNSFWFCVVCVCVCDNEMHEGLNFCSQKRACRSWFSSSTIRSQGLNSSHHIWCQFPYCWAISLVVNQLS